MLNDFTMQSELTNRSPRSHHHGRQRPLGDAARFAARRRASRRSRRSAAHCGARARSRHPRASRSTHSHRTTGRRPAHEVQSIFWMLRAFLRLESERLRQQGARLEVIGRRDRIPHRCCARSNAPNRATADGRSLHLRIAIDYSSRDAITRAAAERFAALPPHSALCGSLARHGHPCAHR